MTFSEFENAYYNFDIVFQHLLEDLYILDTFSLDTVDVDFEDQKIKLNWRDAHQVFDVTNIPQKIVTLKELLPQAKKFHLQVTGGTPYTLTSTQKQLTINWLADQLTYIFMEG